MALAKALDMDLYDFAELVPQAPGSRDWILVWGGAGITGVYLIQLAHHMGYRVICAASPSNHDYVRSLGAEVVLDRWSDPDSLVSQVREATCDSVGPTVLIRPSST